MSPRTVFVGKLLGLYCIVVSFGMFAHQGAVELMKAIIQDPPLLFVTGLMGAMAGLAIVLTHNVWFGGALPVTVTLFGWASLVKGFLLLVLSPSTESQVFIRGLGYEQYPNLYAAVLLLLGSYLTYAALSSTPHPSK